MLVGPETRADSPPQSVLCYLHLLIPPPLQGGTPFPLDSYYHPSEKSNGAFCSGGACSGSGSVLPDVAGLLLRGSDHNVQRGIYTGNDDDPKIDLTRHIHAVSVTHMVFATEPPTTFLG